eukprot:10290182-Alexandrium_andersonii.AAC.1
MTPPVSWRWPMPTCDPRALLLFVPCEICSRTGRACMDTVLPLRIRHVTRTVCAVSATSM